MVQGILPQNGHQVYNKFRLVIESSSICHFHEVSFLQNSDILLKLLHIYWVHNHFISVWIHEKQWGRMYHWNPTIFIAIWKFFSSMHIRSLLRFYFQAKAFPRSSYCYYVWAHWWSIMITDEIGFLFP